jgi:hypothetical protein
MHISIKKQSIRFHNYFGIYLVCSTSEVLQDVLLIVYIRRLTQHSKTGNMLLESYELNGCVLYILNTFWTAFQLATTQLLKLAESSFLVQFELSHEVLLRL